jgi:hypothetical protein
LSSGSSALGDGGNFQRVEKAELSGGGVIFPVSDFYTSSPG